VERVRRVDDHLAAEVFRAGVSDRLLCGVAEYRQNEHFAMLGRLGECARFDALSIAGQPFAQIGLAGIARADHYVVPATLEPCCQAAPNLAGSEYTNTTSRQSAVRHICS